MRRESRYGDGSGDKESLKSKGFNSESRTLLYKM